MIWSETSTRAPSIELLDACQRMEQHIGTKGAYVWIYEQDGVKVLSPHQVRQRRGNTFEGLQRRSMAGLTGSIRECYAGSRERGIPMESNQRQIIQGRLREVRAQNALDLALIANRSTEARHRIESRRGYVYRLPSAKSCFEKQRLRGQRLIWVRVLHMRSLDKPVHASGSRTRHY
jgi:hypothetical protein